MSSHSPSKLELLVKLFNNIIHQKKLVIFIGVNGIINSDGDLVDTSGNLIVNPEDILE